MRKTLYIMISNQISSCASKHEANDVIKPERNEMVDSVGSEPNAGLFVLCEMKLVHCSIAMRLPKLMM